MYKNLLHKNSLLNLYCYSLKPQNTPPKWFIYYTLVLEGLQNIELHIQNVLPFKYIKIKLCQNSVPLYNLTYWR